MNAHQRRTHDRKYWKVCLKRYPFIAGLEKHKFKVDKMSGWLIIYLPIKEYIDNPSVLLCLMDSVGDANGRVRTVDSKYNWQGSVVVQGKLNTIDQFKEWFFRKEHGAREHGEQGWYIGLYLSLFPKSRNTRK